MIFHVELLRGYNIIFLSSFGLHSLIDYLPSDLIISDYRHDERIDETKKLSRQNLLKRLDESTMS